MLCNPYFNDKALKNCNSHREKMSPFVTVFFLLMLLINTSLFLEQEPLYAFGTKGSAVLQVPCTFVDVFVYRLNPDKSRVVSNYSTRDPSTAYFLLNISENQEYFSECWKNGLLMEKRRFHVIVCAQTEGQEKMYYLHGETAQISCQKFNSSRGETLQVFQNLKTRNLRWAGEMILDTSVSLEIIPDALRSRMKVLNEGSLIHLSKTSIMDDGFFSCLVWSDNQCQNHKKIELYIDGQDIFLVSGESYALPCGVKGSPSEDIYWLTPSRSAGEIYEKLNATKTSNYSLVIPHLLPYHTGTYICSSQSETFNELNVFVCSILDPINITFALGDSADLMCAFNLSYFARVQWYREFNQSSEYLLVDRKGHFVKEDMKKRLNASDPNHITISELSIQDGGSYRCRVWALFDIPRGWCISRRVHLTYVTPRLDTFYFVYASLMGLMLLGMISAVVCVTIVSRNRYKREVCIDNYD